MADPSILIIRVLSAEDGVAYHALRLRALRDHPEAFGALLEDWERRTIEQVGARLADHADESQTIGALVDGALVGTITLLREGGKGRHRARIVGMYVAPEQRRLGIGRRLLDEAVRRARRIEGLRMVMLDVADGNDSARGLYLSAGFVPHFVDREAMLVGDRYVDLECMRLVL